MTLLLSACGGDSSTLESLAGTPAAIHIVKDVETMAHSCKEKTKKGRQAAVNAYTDLAKISAIHPDATFGPEEGSELTMRQLQRRTIEKVGHCFGVSVDANGQYHSD
jgi:site-specific recombinase XerC